MRRKLSVVAASALVFGLMVPGALANATAPSHSSSARQGFTAAQRRFLQYGRVVTPGYLRAKALVDAQWARSHPSTAPSAPAGGTAPKIVESFDGPADGTLTPPDSQGAVGPKRFVNLINARFEIFDRTVSPPTMLTSGTLRQFINQPSSVLVFDPYIIWDAGTQRFYFAMGNWVTSSPENYQVAYGWSKTANPSALTDWCTYTTDFGVYGLTGDFPDYPKLGDTKDFILIGINNYPHLQTFAGSDVAWVAKPPAGTSCPSKPKEGVVQKLKQSDGSTAFTPVPANQIDPSSTGYVVANTDLGDPGTVPGVNDSNLLTVIKVTKNGDGTANIPKMGQTFKVATYSIPPSAPQMGSSSKLDTLDGRLESAHEAINPANGKAYLYTAHSVAGGAGSESRWYRINPKRLSKTKMTKVTDSSLFVWNAGISTDRLVNPNGSAFGDSVMVGVTTSSLTTFASDQVVSKIGTNAQSGLVLVKTGAVDSCGQVCRWGDYSAATPDPAADPNGAHGVVWFSQMYHSSIDHTWNWSAKP
jgi:hypothetical protein